MSNNIRFTFSVGDTTWVVYNLGFREQTIVWWPWILYLAYFSSQIKDSWDSKFHKEYQIRTNYVHNLPPLFFQPLW